jgi:hypothetical protein
MVYAGIAPALLVTADVDGEMAGLIAYDHSDDVRSDFDPVDLGIPVGGTVTFKGGPVTFVLDVRYTFGVLEIYDEDDFENEEEPEMRNAVFSFTVGAGL